MAYKSLVPKETEPKEPDFKQLFEEERAQRAELEGRVTSEKQVLVARMDQLENLAAQRFAQREQVAYQPIPTHPKRELTDEEFLVKPLETAGAIAQQVVDERLKTVVDNYGRILGSVVEDAYEAKVENLKHKRFGNDVLPVVQEYFAQNPDLKLDRGSVERVYNEVVGKNLDFLLEQESKRKAEANRNDPALQSNPREIPDMRSRTSSPKPMTPLSGGGTPPKERGAVYEDSRKEEARKEIMKRFNGLGLGLSDEEWQGIESGKLLPKNRWEK